MKISDSNLFSAAGQVRQLNELNLKDGQKVVGKINSIDEDEAILELAGHTIQAKIEGEPPQTGTNQTFLISFDTQGRTILKMIKNFQENGQHDPMESSSTDFLKPVGNSEIASFQKTIEIALVKDNLPVTAENVAKVTRYVQEFQSRYQVPIDPKVFSFMMAQKWPLTPATILAAWLDQEPKVRDLVRKQLQDSVMKQEGNGVILESLLKLPSNASEIAQKLKLASNSQIFDDKSKPVGEKNESNVADTMSAERTPNDELSKKLQWILEQNFAIHKVLIKESSMGSPINFIPLLVNDSQSNIHECFIEWKQEKEGQSQNNNNQLINLAVPTENLGTITIGLRISPHGTHINLKVANEEICQYLNLHTAEIKSAIAKVNVSVAVNIAGKKDTYSEIRGVDLWM